MQIAKSPRLIAQFSSGADDALAPNRHHLYVSELVMVLA